VALARHAQGVALGWGGVPRAQEEAEGEIFVSSKEDAEGLPVVGAEAAQEAGVGDEAVPAGADEGRAGEPGRQRGQAEEYLRGYLTICRLTEDISSKAILILVITHLSLLRAVIYIFVTFADKTR
jgi:hypothetical protein